MINQKNIHIYLPKILIFLIIFYYVFQLNYFRHWSSISDQDLTIIHNSLLLNSGFKAEYHDHPGHTLIYILSIWLSFLDFLKIINSSSYIDLNNSQAIQNDFNQIIIFSRFLNILISLTIIYPIYNILKINNLNRVNNYLLITTFILSQTFLNSIGHIRTEMLSAGCIFMSLLYLFKLTKKNILNRKYIFLSGFFISLSVFCKFQSIFVLIFFPLIFFILKKKKIEISYKKYELNNSYTYLTFIYFVIIGVLCKKYMHGLNFIILPGALIFIFFFLYHLNKRFFNNIEFKNLFLFYFLAGVGVGFVFLVIFKPFHTNNIGMVFNFIGSGNMFINSENPYSYKFADIIELLNLSISNFDYYLNEILSNRYNEILLFIILILSFFSNPKRETFIILLIFNFILFGIIAIFSTRPEINYLIYISPIIYIFLSFINNLNKKILGILLIFITIFNFSNSFKYVEAQKLLTEETALCSFDNLNKKNIFWDRMRSDVFIYICK